jgi:uncharacterized protein YyaL (SSP411 family)
MWQPWRPRRTVPLSLAVFLAGAVALGAWLLVARPFSPPPPKQPARLRPGNLVLWQPWGETVFSRAQAEERPIFLLLDAGGSAASARLRQEVFADRELAGLLNDACLPVRVEVEERPDVAEVYGAAAGVVGVRSEPPLALWLLPDGRPFAGTGPLPRGQFLKLLQRMDAAWSSDRKRAELADYAASVAENVRQMLEPEATPRRLNDRLVAFAALDLQSDLDRQHGGFGRGAKALPTARLAFLLRAYQREPGRALLADIRTTLDAMAGSPTCDPVAGGFFNGAYDEAWRSPRLEKRLAENAELAVVYLEAYRLTAEPEYGRIGTETLDFMLGALRTPSGAFHGGIADESEAPGPRHYLWTRTEMDQAVAPDDRQAAWRWFELTQPPDGPGLLYHPVRAGKAQENDAPADEALEAHGDRPDGIRLHGETAPLMQTGALGAIAMRSQGRRGRRARRHRRAVSASLPGTAEISLGGDLAVQRARACLLAVRERRPAPPLDTRFLPAANGSAVRAFARGFAVTRNERYHAAASAAATALLERLRQGGKLPRGDNGVAAAGPVMLDDYAALAAGLLDLHAATGESRWLREAGSVIATMQQALWDDARGKFLRSTAGAGLPGVRPWGEQDGAGLAPAALAAVALQRFARETGDDTAAARAERILTLVAARAAADPETYAGMLIGIDLELGSRQ